MEQTDRPLDRRLPGSSTLLVPCVFNFTPHPPSGLLPSEKVGKGIFEKEGGAVGGEGAKASAWSLLFVLIRHGEEGAASLHA